MLFLTCTKKKYCTYNLYKKSTYKQKCKNLNHTKYIKQTLINKHWLRLQRVYIMKL